MAINWCELGQRPCILGNCQCGAFAIDFPVCPPAATVLRKEGLENVSGRTHLSVESDTTVLLVDQNNIVQARIVKGVFSRSNY